MTETTMAFEMPLEEIHSIAELGEGLRLLRRRNIEMTIEFANTFLEIPEFAIGDEKIDRKLQEAWVIHLAREMIAGTFRWEQVTLATCNCEGRKFRMNGQHSAWARLYADEELSKVKGLRTPVQLLEYEAASEQDMRQLYATIDRGKPRNRGMVVTSYTSGTEEFPGYSKGVLRFLAQGLTWWLWATPDLRSLHTGDEVAMLMLRDHHKVCLAVGSFIRESKPADFRHLKRQPVIAAMFATFNKAPQVARDFWIKVRDGIGLTSKEDPQLTLRNYLMTASLAATRLTAGDGKIVDTEDMFKACLMAWNAHRINRPLKLLKPTQVEGRPEVR
jgi:hypothetical protein